MKLELFDFELPPELIAQTPAATRDSSRLMVLERGRPTPPQHYQFHQVREFLQAGDLLVLNNTRVFPARLPAQKATGGKVELLLLEVTETSGPSSGAPVLHLDEASPPNFSDIQNKKNMEHSDKDVISQACLSDAKMTTALPELSTKWTAGEIWHALAKTNRPLREGTWLHLPEGQHALVLCRHEGGYLLQLDASLARPNVFEYLERVGQMPLPPYIDPDHGDIDHKQRYQTVFAHHVGAVAAPTAGLHFTPTLLSELQAQGVRLAELTLHVGLGTFLPVRVDNILEHEMHAETFEVPESTVALWNQTKAEGGRVIAVGTTSLRALEAASQETGTPQSGRSSTSIFIYPGYEFQAVDGLLTNFHLPKSTLLMLVAALHGRTQMLKAYNIAVQEGYRFYSYGDAMLIL